MNREELKQKSRAQISNKLYLSFIGWMLLTLVTCGVLGIWTIPYMNVTFTNAYLSLKPADNE